MAHMEGKYKTYNGDPSQLSVWLESNPRSQIKSSDGVRGITVSGPDDDGAVSKQRIQKLRQSFEDSKSYGNPVSLETITQLAKTEGIMGGKWIFYPKTEKVNCLWSIVADKIVKGHIAGTFAKVSSNDEGPWVCVYNLDFTDTDQVKKLEADLRLAGIECDLKYKPDVYTYLGIDPKNKWRLKPTIYDSVYDVATGKSDITYYGDGVDNTDC